MVTEVGVFLSSILGLHYAKDINFIFFSFKLSVPLFSHRRVMGSHILHSSIGLES